MNPKFKWLLLGAGALVLLLVMLVVFASCRAASDADRRAEALAEQLRQTQNATPVPTATAMPSATARSRARSNRSFQMCRLSHQRRKLSGRLNRWCHGAAHGYAEACHAGQYNEEACGYCCAGGYGGIYRFGVCGAGQRVCVWASSCRLYGHCRAGEGAG